MWADARRSSHTAVVTFGTYPPLGILKSVAPDAWIVDGPIIRFGPPGLRLPFPTRMTLLRWGDERLLVHSPTPLTAELKRQIDALGTVSALVAPNRLHYWWIPEWHAAYPGAEVWLAPRVREQSKGRIDFAAQELSGTEGYPWDDAIATLPIVGDYLIEVEFFHRATRTLVLTDLIENFEPDKLRPGMRLLARLGGALAPDGQTPRDLRLMLARHRETTVRAKATMLAWHPERVLLAHGQWYRENGTAELERALRWVT